MIKSEYLQIKNLSDERYKYIDEWYDSWDDTSGTYSIKENPKIDILAEEIINKLLIWRNLLPIEFIIEELSKLGHSPNILYDDNGNFAVAGEGWQELRDNKNPQEYVVICNLVKKDMWKPSLKEAIYYYLDNIFEDDIEAEV